MYACLGFSNLSVILESFALTQNEQCQLAQRIADDDILSLAGRVLLLATAEGTRFQNTQSLDSTLEQFNELKDVFAMAISAVPELFHDWSIEWNKVMAHIGWPVEMGMVEKEGKGGEATKYVSSTSQAWTRSLGLLRGRERPRGCAYPRCFGLTTSEATLKIRYTCGRCRIVAYCNTNYQRA
ncbi:hypothetical protein FRC07_004672 [Ceratobasidium sp. 392]|nr:hypothetical protein FRC07_004672 [Ceratobasidium sp. 392]